jgi:predicted esterase
VCVLKDVPVWAFHGAQDPVVRLEESANMVDALRACGGDVRFTVYPDAGHDSWTEAYDTSELYTWFLSHSR